MSRGSWTSWLGAEGMNSTSGVKQEDSESTLDIFRSASSSSSGHCRRMERRVLADGVKPLKYPPSFSTRNRETSLRSHPKLKDVNEQERRRGVYPLNRGRGGLE